MKRMAALVLVALLGVGLSSQVGGYYYQATTELQVEQQEVNRENVESNRERGLASELDVEKAEIVRENWESARERGLPPP